MMERRRKSVSDLPETDPETGTSSSTLERLRSPLLDRRALRSTSSRVSTTSESLVHLPKPHSHSRSSSSSSSKPPLRPPVVEKKQPTSISRSKSAPSPPSISRSRSAPFHHRSASGGGGGPQSLPRDHAPFRSSGRSSPQYRANSAVVRFDERLLPVRMNYGIAGYNTSRRRGESRGRQGVVLRTRSRNVRVVGLGLWTRRVLVRVMRTRVRSACSRLLMRFRRPRR